MHYLFVFAQAHNDFRLPELHSVAELHGFKFSLAPAPNDRDPSRPYMIVDLVEEEHARILARRCVLVKSVYEFYSQGASYEELHRRNRTNEALWSSYIPDTSFKFIVTAYNHKIPHTRQREVVESFSYMGLLGKIDMNDPDIIFGCFEEYHDRHKIARDKYAGDGQFRQVFFGRLLEEGSARSLIAKFDVKQRVYYGNTSMESEISLLMANQTLASPGKFVYDPFMGTGSTAYPITYFGALMFGSDIDGRQMRGKGTPPGVIRAATQYGTTCRIVDLCTFDVTRHPWRCGALFDAIVTDPPYGVRAGAKRIGRKKELGSSKSAQFMEHQKLLRNDQPYIPPTKPYEFSHLAIDLVLLARYLLKPDGRLVFFVPTVTDEYEELDIEQILCDGMEIVANSLQDFGPWGRRLVTIRKTTTSEYPPPPFEPRERMNTKGFTHVPAHKDFREKYFQGFRKDNGDPT